MSRSRVQQPVLKTGDLRLFIQTDGPSPDNPYHYYGCASLGEITQDQGEPTPVYCPDPERRGRWVIVDMINSVPGLGSVSLTHRGGAEMRDALWDIRDRGCEFNIQVVAGKCGRPDNFEQWEGKLVIRGNRLTSFTLPGASPLSGEENAAFEMGGDLSFIDLNPIHALVFGAKADATVLAEVLDGFFIDYASCGDCGAATKGCDKQFWLTAANAGSPGLSAQLVYSLDGNVFQTSDINTLGGGSGVSMLQVGNYIVVLDAVGDSHHITRMSDVEEGTNTWSEVTVGYVSPHGPIKGFSASSARTYIVGEDGYVYLMTSPNRGVSVLSDGSVTTQTLNDVHGAGKLVVAVGDANAVIASRNEGRTFSLVVGPAPATDLNAVFCLSENLWYVGTATGDLFYTLNGGRTWVEVVLDGDITSINDIAFTDEVVGYLAVSTTSGGRVYRTTTSGYVWSADKPELDSLPMNTDINVVAACGYNTVGAGGVVSGGDGLIAVAS